MKGPGFSINVVKDPSRTVWSNNEDPAKLDAMYNRLLGSKGDRMLPDEIKWLAVTHKSFDQGRRGFNTRLAYFGVFQPPAPFEASFPASFHSRPKPRGACQQER
jgi:large subunit ribosomal protein L15